MSCLITQTCNGYTVTLKLEVLSIRPVSDGGMQPSGILPQRADLPLPESPAVQTNAREKGGEKESEKKVTQRKEKEKDPERECLASQLSHIAEAWNSLPLKKIARFTGRRKERTEMLLAQYPEEEIVRVIYSITRSRFLLGGGANHWQIRFDWFILPANFEKVRSGNYLDEEDENGVNPDSRLRFSAADLQTIDQVWTDSGSNRAGGSV